MKRKVAAVGFFALCTLLGVIMYQTEINKAWPGNVATGIRTRNQGHTLGEAGMTRKSCKSKLPFYSSDFFSITIWAIDAVFDRSCGDQN